MAALLALAAGSAAQARAADTGTSTLPQVLERLRREIEAVPATDPSPIDTVLQRHVDSTGLSFDIATTNADGSAAAAPAQPAGVSAAEWQALRKYRGAADSVQDDLAGNGSHHSPLFDLDEDGQRDLLDSAYVGGTGLFTEIAVRRRDAAHGFLAPPGDAPGSEPVAGVFSINGRGGDQALYWLRIDGRSYAAYRDGDYFQDTLALSRPLSPLADERSSARVLQVRYRYRHTLAPLPQDPVQAAPEDRDAARWLARRPQLRAVADRQLQRLGFDARGRQTQPGSERALPGSGRGRRPRGARAMAMARRRPLHLRLRRRSAPAARIGLLQRQPRRLPQPRPDLLRRLLRAVAVRRARPPGGDLAAAVPARARQRRVDRGDAARAMSMGD